MLHKKNIQIINKLKIKCHMFIFSGFIMKPVIQSKELFDYWITIKSTCGIKVFEYKSDKAWKIHNISHGKC